MARIYKGQVPFYLYTVVSGTYDSLLTKRQHILKHLLQDADSSKHLKMCTNLIPGSSFQGVHTKVYNIFKN